jgi:hypothetical protein
MIPGFHKLPTPFLCFLLLGVLSGCVIGLEGIFYPLEDLAHEAKMDSPDYYRTGKNHYEPMIIDSNKDWIRVKYLSVGPNAEHEQVVQLIIEHCDGTYLETNRAELRGYTTVEAECTRGAESLQ